MGEIERRLSDEDLVKLARSPGPDRWELVLAAPDLLHDLRVERGRSDWLDIIEEQLAEERKVSAALRVELAHAENCRNDARRLLFVLADACDASMGTSTEEQADTVFAALEVALGLPGDPDLTQIASAIRKVCGVSDG